MRKLYPAYIHRNASGGFDVSFPDVAAIAGGATFEEAVGNAADNLAANIDATIEEGMAVPEPSTTNEAMAQANADPEMAEGFEGVQLIAVYIAEKSERVLITLPGTLLRRIDAATSNRSGFIADACREKLERAAPLPTFDLRDNRLIPRAQRSDGAGANNVPVNSDRQPFRSTKKSRTMAADAKETAGSKFTLFARYRALTATAGEDKNSSKRKAK